MKHVKLYEEWSAETSKAVNEFYGKDFNLWKVADSKTPIIGRQIFADDDKGFLDVDYEKLKKSIEDAAKSYDQHMKDAEVFVQNWKTKLEGQKGIKGTLEFITKTSKARDMAYDIVKRGSKFALEYNDLFRSLQEDLTSTDHVRVAKAITKLKEIYPWELVKDAGMLKRLTSIKYDTDFIKSALTWVRKIVRNYDELTEVAKTLGKTEKQIAGARKQAAAQSMRWGSY